MSTVTPDTLPAPARRTLRRRVSLIVLAALLLPVLLFGGKIVVEWGPTWWTLWRDVHPGVSVPASTDAAQLAAATTPAGWPLTGECSTPQPTRCARYKGEIQVGGPLTAAAAADQVIASVKSAGLLVKETFCRPVAEGAEQCLVRATANRDGAEKLVSYMAFVRVGPTVRHVTFAIEAA